MPTRINALVAKFAPGEVAPEYVCQWDAKPATENWVDWEEWGRERACRQTHNGWWNTGWGYMAPKGRVKGQAVYIAAPAHIWDKFFEPESNEWGEVCP